MVIVGAAVNVNEVPSIKSSEYISGIGTNQSVVTVVFSDSLHNVKESSEDT